MKLFRAYVLLFAVVTAVCARTVIAQHVTAADLFHQGLTLERADGNETGAIFIFERVVAEFPTDRETTPQALYHLGELYAKKSDPRAMVVLTRVTTDFPASEYATKARTKIAEIGAQAGAPFKETDINGYLKDVNTQLILGSRSSPFSPDGRLVSYAKGWPAAERYYVRDLKTGIERTVFTTTGRFGAFEWSPDGARIALEVRFGPADQPPTRRELHLIDVATRQDRLVHTAEGPPIGSPSAGPFAVALFYRLSWAPDGRYLAYDATMPSDVRLLGLATGQSQSYGPAGNAGMSPANWTPEFTWSADSQRFLFHVTTRGATEAIKIVTVAAGDARDLPLPGAGPNTRISLGVWKRNGTLPLWTRTAADPNTRVGTLLSLATGATTPACVDHAQDGDRCEAIMADGTHALVWRKASTNYAIRDLATGIDTPLTTGSGEERAGFASFDGRLIAFRSNRDGRWAQYVVPMDVIPVSDPARLMYLDGNPVGLSAETWRWTEEGRIVQALTVRESDVYRINLDVATAHAISRPERLTQDARVNQTPSISPDGKRIAYSIISGRGDWWAAVMDANGANERPLVPIGLPDRGTWISPLDLLIRRSEPFQLERKTFVDINLDSGRSTPHAGAPVFNADASYTIFVPQTREWLHTDYVTGTSEAGDQMVLKAQAADGTTRTIVSTHDFEGFAVSHDGKLIAVATEPGHSKPNELHLMTTAGAELKFLVGTGAKDDSYYLYPWAWSPNDKFLLYELEADVSTLNVLDIATGAHWPLVDPNGPEGKMDLTGADWSPDGSFVVAGHYEQRHVWHVFDGVNYETVKRLTTVRK